MFRLPSGRPLTHALPESKAKCAWFFRMKLRDVLPKEFFPKHMYRSTGYFGVRTTPAARLLDVEVKAEHTA
jgi:hypothetical protein